VRTTARALAELRAALLEADACAPQVSAWSAGMHVQHCALVMLEVAGALASSAPPPAGRPSVLGHVLLRLGRIPRGRAKSPATVRPPERVDPAEVTGLLEKAERALRDVEGMAPAAWFRHFAFGTLRRDRALRFVRIHNDHHLRIVEDIRGAGKGSAGGR